MARSFNGAEKLVVTVPIVTTTPLTLACWFKPTSASVRYPLVSINDNGTSATVDGWHLHTTATATLVSRTDAAGVSATATTTATYSAGVWAHGCAVFSGSTSRSIFLNGTNKVNDVTSITPSGVTQTELGHVSALGGTVSSIFLTGSLAECAIWNIALADAEVAVLGSFGMSPLLMHPESLVFYAPLISGQSPELELMQANNLTLTGTAVVDGPALFYPRRGIQPAMFDRAQFPWSVQPSIGYAFSPPRMIGY